MLKPGTPWNALGVEPIGFHLKKLRVQVPQLSAAGTRGGQISRIADSIAQRSGDTPLVVGMDRYAIASELAFYAPDQAEGVARSSSGHLFGQVGLMYERWFPPDEERGRNLLLIAWNPADLGSDRVASAVARLDPIEEGVLTRGDGIIRRYYYRVGYGYRGAPRQASAAD